MVKRILIWLLTLALLSLLLWVVLTNGSRYKLIGNTNFFLSESYSIDNEGKSMVDLYYGCGGDGAGYGVKMKGFPLDIRWNDRYLLVRCYDRNNKDSISNYCIIDCVAPQLPGPPYTVTEYDNREDFETAVSLLGIKVSEMQITDNRIRRRMHLRSAFKGTIQLDPIQP